MSFFILIFSNIKDLIFDVCRKESKLIAGKMAMLIWFL
jgi:nucleosome binding factor SPN SPT16 subunit